MGADTRTSHGKALFNQEVYVCLLGQLCLGELGEKFWKKLDTRTHGNTSLHSILGIWLLARHIVLASSTSSGQYCLLVLVLLGFFTLS